MRTLLKVFARLICEIGMLVFFWLRTCRSGAVWLARRRRLSVVGVCLSQPVHPGSMLTYLDFCLGAWYGGCFSLHGWRLLCHGNFVVCVVANVSAYSQIESFGLHR